MKKIMTIILAVFAVNCMSGMTRGEQEARMAATLEKMAPLAQQIEDHKKAVMNANLKGAQTGNASAYMRDFQRTQGVESTQRVQNVMAELGPYQQQFSGYKWAYVSDFGQIEYNEWIKRRGAGWGLGLYW